MVSLPELATAGGGAKTACLLGCAAPLLSPAAAFSAADIVASGAARTILGLLLARGCSAQEACPWGLPPSAEALWHGTVPRRPERCVTDMRGGPAATQGLEGVRTCTSLVPPGTGSTATFLGLEEIWKALPERPAAASSPWHHEHSYRIDEPQRPQQTHLPAPDCFVLSVRDPAARFQSLWSLDALAHGKQQPMLEMTALWGAIQGVKRDTHYPVQYFRTATEWLAAVRNASNPGYPSAMRSFWASAANPNYRTTWVRRGKGNHVYYIPWNASVEGGGSISLVSQLDYLRGLQCGRQRLYVVCNEHLTDDLNVLARHLGSAFNRSSTSVAFSRASAPVQSATRKSVVALTDADKHFVRHCLYPWDTALHERLCITGPEGALSA